MPIFEIGSKSEFMRSDPTGKGESGREIAAQLINLLDVGDQGSIHSLLSGLSLGFPLSLSVLAFFSVFGSGLGGILQLVLGESHLLLEEGVVDVHGHTVQGNSGAGRDNMSSVHSLKGNSVDGIRASHEDVSSFEVLQNNNSSSSVGS